MKSIKKGSAINLFVLVLLLTGCQSKFKHTIEKSENSVTVYQDSVKINIEIVNESIIHVHKIMVGSKPSLIPDYVTVLEPQNVDWDLEEIENQITISTAEIKVLINSDGTIEYQDKEGENLVSETNEMTYLKPKKGDGKTNISQAFVAGDEALYGLGQFQSGIMNWKNVPMRLTHYNQEIAIPFLVSTKGYGIYWHNYSITDFNQPENEIKFPKLDRKKENDEEVILSTNKEKENVIESAVVVDQEKNIRKTVFVPEKSGKYTFFVEADTGSKMRGEIRVTIDNDTIVNYNTIWVPTCYSGVKNLEAGKEYKIVFQNTGSRIDGKLYFNEPDFNKTVFSSRAGNAIDYYLVHGDNPTQTVSEYSKLTGAAPLFSKSSYGFWQCRERYHNQDELLENAREMRKREIPVDNIVQDWFYWPEGEKGPEWDRTKYPDPKGMVDELKSLNLKLMVSVWPEVKNKPLIKKYKLNMVGSKIDAHHPETRERYYKMLSDSMFQIGVNSIWLDGSEPAGRASSDVQTAVGPNDEVVNSYSLLVSRAVYEGRRKEFPNERVFNLTRSAYAGQQRYGVASWSGDTQSTWEQFAEQIPAGLNFTMAGVPYWTHDIGGFFRDSNSLNPIYDSQYTNPEYIELLTRWFQFGTFSPIFRIHGYVSETEIWRYGSEFESTARKFIDLRYKLMPYIYSEARKVTIDSKLLMAPLVYQYPDDKNTWGIKDQFLFGESILVCIVTEYEQRSKEIYLPKGTWYNFWSDEKMDGNVKTTVDTPLNETPIYVKAGSILPMGPKVQFATQKTDEAMLIKVYPGKDAEYVLYLDDNESYDYEKGEFSEIVFSYSDVTKELKIKKGSGDYIDFKESPMSFTIEMVGDEKIQNIIFNNEEITLKF